MTKSARSRITETGGRQATTRHIPPVLALAVGMPSTPAPKGWKWWPLSSLARLESGHTPSRRQPEYWGGSIPWIGIADAKAHHGRQIMDTVESTNDLGIANSSARVLPKHTVCLSRTASVGYVVVMGRPMATSQDFVNWVCGPEIDPNFLKYLLIAEGKDLLRFASGAVHSTIYFPEAKAFHVCIPELREQQRIVGILDEALAGISIARTSAQRNCKNASAIFESHLQSIFTLCGKEWMEKPLGTMCERITKGSSPKWQGINYIDKPGVLFVTSENVGEYRILMEKPKYVEEKFNTKDKKSILKSGDVLTNIVGASIGRTAVFELHDVANINQAVCLIRCDPSVLNNYYLSYLLNSPVFKQILHENEVDNARANLSLGFFSQLLVPVPPLRIQRDIVTKLNALREQTRVLQLLYERKLAALDALKKSLLHEAFSGGLPKSVSHAVVVPFPTKVPNITTTDLHAGILATAYGLHEKYSRQKHFGHVKAEKIAHMVEAHLGIDLDRSPIKDAAGPNDYPHQQKVEHRARKAGYFDFKRVEGAGYQVKRLCQFDALVNRARESLGERNKSVDELLELMLPMTTQQAEICATVHAAWNNLLLDGQSPTDEEIVYEARENWHPAKLNIPRERFFAAIDWLREKNIVPIGKGKKVATKTGKK